MTHPSNSIWTFSSSVGRRFKPDLHHPVDQGGLAADMSEL